MEKVFSRWPSQAQPSPPNEAGGPDKLPRWMRAAPARRWPRLLGDAAVAVLVVAVPSGLGLAAGVSGDPWRIALLSVLAATAAGAAAYVMLSRRALAQCRAQNEAIFGRAGISMYREDWTAVGLEVAALRRNGVSDIETYFATRPEELRALCAKVIIKDVNAFTVEEAGATEKAPLLGPLDRLIPPTDQTFVQWLVAFARGDRFFRSEAHARRPDGSEFDALFTAALPDDVEGFANIIVSCFDITGYKSEQVKLLAADAQIARASRISTVGALSASIAHEVNSPLAAIVANAQAALRWLKRPSPDLSEALEAVSAIVIDASRAKDVVTRTRAFVSNSPGAIETFDLVAAAREANLLVERELRSCGAAVHLNAEPSLPAVQGDVVQVQQVFTNLLVNAAQAMAGQPGPKEVTISFVRQAGDVRVDVADTGPGIDPQQLERVFDPFYTTKPEGIGMGLAICRNCMDAQGGSIWATSAGDKGATIHFTLPIARG